MNRRLYIMIGAGAALFIFLVFLFAGKENSKTSSVTGEYLLKAKEELQGGNIIKARGLLMKAMDETEDPAAFESLRENIEGLNMRILFSPLIDECSGIYEVKPNDTLIGIAKKSGTTVALIKRANNIIGDVIRPGQKLKVHTCTFSIAVDKSQNLLFLKQNGSVVKTYPVSTGKDNSTPTGKFTITSEKLKNPTWFKTGAVVPPESPQNILGTRWIGLSIKGYGIHGNRDEGDIGKQVTAGCIRMKNKDVEELFDIVPAGTEIVIVD